MLIDYTFKYMLHLYTYCFLASSLSTLTRTYSTFVVVVVVESALSEGCRALGQQ
jgi:hypothetical protein